MIRFNNEDVVKLKIQHYEEMYPIDIFKNVSNVEFNEFDTVNKDEVIQQLTELLKAEQNTVRILKDTIVNLTK